MRFNWFKIAYGFIALISILLLVQYAVQILHGGHPWKTGDWLINYSDGLIRRGLTGSVALLAANYLGLHLKWTVFALQAFFYSAFIILVLQKFYSFKNNPKSILFLLSPAFAFVFWINDPSIAFRKEIIAYVSLVVVLKSFSKPIVNWRLYILGLLLYFFAGLSHESVIFLFPFFLFPIYSYFASTGKEWLSMWKPLLPLLFLTLLILLVAVLYKGSEVEMIKICHSVQSFTFKDDICKGAISWLQYDMRYGYQSVVNLGALVWINYLFLAIFSFAPILLLKPEKSFFWMCAAGCLFMLPLFVIAVDHGRFISMIYTSSILVAMWMRPKYFIQSLPISGLIGFFYCFFWGLPNTGFNSPGAGLLGSAIRSLLGV
jgi:hypothetical protein